MSAVMAYIPCGEILTIEGCCQFCQACDGMGLKSPRTEYRHKVFGCRQLMLPIIFRIVAG